MIKEKKGNSSRLTEVNVREEKTEMGIIVSKGKLRVKVSQKPI
jgi:hypothetical protein